MDVPLNDEIIIGYRIKFVIIGDKKVGKTTLVNLYTKNKVIRDYKETTSIEIYKAIIININILIFIFIYSII